jgi:hypothetical protein
MAVDLGRSAAMSALMEHRRNHGYILLLLAYYVIVRRAFRVHSIALIVVSFLVGSLFSSKSESIVEDAISLIWKYSNYVQIKTTLTDFNQN